MKKLILILILLFNNTFAQEFGIETGLEIPRYVSLKSNDINIRVGPSVNYPIVLKYVKENYPVMIVEEYEDWRKVIDFRHNSGWIHTSQLKKSSSVILTQSQYVFSKPTKFSEPLAIVEKGKLILIEKCKNNWCKLSNKEISGWMVFESFWGILPN